MGVNLRSAVNRKEILDLQGRQSALIVNGVDLRLPVEALIRMEIQRV